MNRDTAVNLAEHGFWIFPTNWENKKPSYSLHRARNDPRIVEKQWAAHPNRLPAINVGKSGLLVIDLDVGHQEGVDGRGAFTELIDNYGGGEWPLCPVVRTPRGGFHIYTRNSSYLSNGTLGLPAGIDIRADPRNGYTCFGIMADGTYYELVEGSWDDIPDTPAWFLDLLDRAVDREIAAHVPTPLTGSSDRHRAWALACLRAQADMLAATPVGYRNHAINKAAFTVGGHSLVLSMGEAADALYGACVTNGYVTSRDPSDGVKAFRRSFLSGWKDGAARPLRGPPTDPVLPPMVVRIGGEEITI
jgi:Bifunctional DNA primase/polymerase, N-terminal